MSRPVCGTCGELDLIDDPCSCIENAPAQPPERMSEIDPEQCPTCGNRCGEIIASLKASAKAAADVADNFKRYEQEQRARAEKAEESMAILDMRAASFAKNLYAAEADARVMADAMVKLSVYSEPLTGVGILPAGELAAAVERWRTKP